MPLGGKPESCQTPGASSFIGAGTYPTMETDPARLLAAIRYMTLATADEEGRPWSSPVWFAAPTPSELLWVSDPNARHSRNIAARPEVAIVVFDSTVPENAGWGLYMEATAAETDTADVERFHPRLDH